MSNSLPSQHASPLEPEFGGVPLEPEGTSTFDLQEKVLFALGRHRWLVFSLIAIGTAIGIVVAAGSPNVYTSRARFRLRAGKVETLGATASLVLSGVAGQLI
jgi:uncharacterized protein involved in exopolysaccharide biosynthesis